MTFTVDWALNAGVMISNLPTNGVISAGSSRGRGQLAEVHYAQCGTEEQAEGSKAVSISLCSLRCLRYVLHQMETSPRPFRLRQCWMLGEAARNSLSHLGYWTASVTEGPPQKTKKKREKKRRWFTH